MSAQNKYTNTIKVSSFPRACGNRFNIYLHFFFKRFVVLYRIKPNGHACASVTSPPLENSRPTARSPSTPERFGASSRHGRNCRHRMNVSQISRNSRNNNTMSMMMIILYYSFFNNRIFNIFNMIYNIFIIGTRTRMYGFNVGNFSFFND